MRTGSRNEPLARSTAPFVYRPPEKATKGFEHEAEPSSRANG
jgi:hypothetical protein